MFDDDEPFPPSEARFNGSSKSLTLHALVRQLQHLLDSVPDSVYVTG